MNKTSFFQVEFKKVEVKKNKIKITGLASTPDIDRYDDIVNITAFNGSIETYKKNPIVLLQHESNKPIGRTITAEITSKGLEVTAEITENTDGVFEKIQNKVLGAFSIGFIANAWVMTERAVNGQLRNIREITSLDLVEISVVSTPANANALFTMTKSLKKLFDEIQEEEKDVEVIEEETKPNEIEVIIDNTEEVKEEVETPREEEVLTEEIIEELVEDVKETKEEYEKVEEPLKEDPKSEEVEIQAETPADESQTETEIENEVEKHFEAKSLELTQLFETKLVEVEEKRLEVTALLNEIKSIKVEMDKDLSETKDMVKNLKSIVVKKGVEVKSTSNSYFNYFNKTI